MAVSATAEPHLAIELGPLRLRSPVLVASGTFGYGIEYSDLVDMECLGAICAKGITLAPREGNPPPRICETPSGMLNAIGLQNPGVEVFIEEKLPPLRELGAPVIANINGETYEEYEALARRLSDTEGIAAIELNVSCPNVKRGGMHFGTDEASLSELTRRVRAATDLPLIVKLSPNVTDIVSLAEVAVKAGADALSLINTLLGMSIDVERRRPRLAFGTGGLSGPAIRPVAVRIVYQVWRALRCPIVGMGGIMTAEDALEFILAGATAVAVGTATFVRPGTAADVYSGVASHLAAQGVAKVEELVGAAHDVQA